MGAFVTALLLYFDPRTLSGEPCDRRFWSRVWDDVICLQAARGVIFILMRLVITVVVLAGSYGIFLATHAETCTSPGERAALRAGVVIFTLAAFFGMHAIQLLNLLVLKRRGLDLHAPGAVRNVLFVSVPLGVGWGILLMRSPKRVEV
jgi:hypothetical protein